jgi:hypothetical protein
MSWINIRAGLILHFPRTETLCYPESTEVRLMSTQAVLTLLGLKASQELKNLLENKHLYQHVTINAGEILKQQIEAEEKPNLKIYLFKWSANELPKSDSF